MNMILGLLLAVALQDKEAEGILSRYRSARPADSDLALYRLDWVEDLKTAKTRAAKEKRPILFIATRQLEDAGSLYTGHC